ncbi:unnamed protein product [Mytilus edulis]|uniref:Endonuclease/exonuclease/phosphatase domain-containing protein n=1 Tax=Mytilus edulis TaxID=6550 RepID=A0A8S3ST33_MYTED|nr:unnamed protein product [Mytilus edulis]
MIKKLFSNFIKVVKVLHDTIIWLQVSKDVTICGQDYYVGCVYLPPISSNYYKMYECDIFYELINCVEKYSTESSKVFLLGDMNARTAIGNDFIKHDSLYGSIFDDFNHIFNYMSDNNLPVRRNPDQGTNEYGTKLLNLCRSTGLRIVNGRHKDGTANDFTFCGSRGMSVVDYLIVPFDYFHIVEQFIVSNFTSFSDHAPLHIRLQCKALSYTHEQQNLNVSSSTFDSFRWNDDLKEQCYESLILNSGLLSQIVFCDAKKSQDGIDNYIETFTTQLTDIVAPFFRSTSNKSIDCQRTSRKFVCKTTDKPWFNCECRRLRHVYLSALNMFNKNKIAENHQRLISTKRQYKVFENKLKRQYKHQEGDMLEHLRKSDPKKFYRMFQKKRAKNTEVPLSSFFEHFKELSSSNTPIVNDTQRGCVTVCFWCFELGIMNRPGTAG